MMDWKQILGIIVTAATLLGLIWNLGNDIRLVRETRADIIDELIRQVEHRENFVECVANNHLNAEQELVCWQQYERSLEDQQAKLLRFRDKALK